MIEILIKIPIIIIIWVLAIASIKVLLDEVFKFDIVHWLYNLKTEGKR